MAAPRLSRFPSSTSLAADYVRRLPRGLASYPQCTAKATLVNAYLAAKPIDRDAVPPELDALLARPPRANEWVPETHFVAVSLLVRERHFLSDDSFLSWVKSLNAELFKGPIYRALMAVASRTLLIKGTELRWRQFHQGTTLEAHHDGKSDFADFKLSYEPKLFETLQIQLFAVAFEAALEAAGSGRCHTAFVEATGTEARLRIKW